VTVPCIFQRIDWHHSTDRISSLARAGRTIIHRLAWLFTIGILQRTYFRDCCCARSKRAEFACARPILKSGSQSQCYAFRESTHESMSLASGTRPKKNSRETAPFRRATDQPLEHVAQKFYSVLIWIVHLHYLVRGTWMSKWIVVGQRVWRCSSSN